MRASDMLGNSAHVLLVGSIASTYGDPVRVGPSEPPIARSRPSFSFTTSASRRACRSCGPGRHLCVCRSKISVVSSAVARISLPPPTMMTPPAHVASLGSSRASLRSPTSAHCHPASDPLAGTVGFSASNEPLLLKTRPRHKRAERAHNNWLPFRIIHSKHAQESVLRIIGASSCTSCRARCELPILIGIREVSAEKRPCPRERKMRTDSVCGTLFQTRLIQAPSARCVRGLAG